MLWMSVEILGLFVRGRLFAVNERRARSFAFDHLTAGLGNPNIALPNRKPSVHRTKGRRMKTWALALGLALLLGSCAEETPTAPAASDETIAAEGGETFGAEEISFGEALAQIRGHHDAAVELYKGGDNDLALVHAGHPIDEILASVSSELEEHAPEHVAPLELSLEEVRGLIQDGSSPEKLAQKTEEVATITFDAQLAVVEDAAETPAFTGSVIAALLGTSAHEYEEAVAGSNGISLLEEYQDGFAFVAEAKDMYASIEGDVRSAAVEEAREIQEAFDELDAAFPALEEPEEPLPVAPVEDAAELIGHELEETVGAQLLEASDPEEVVANIEALLDEVIAAYEAGDADAAGELAAEAYLENYEVIEAGVIEHAPEVNEELEPLLGADLRKEISAGTPVAEIEAMVERARELLAEALEAVEGGH